MCNAAQGVKSGIHADVVGLIEPAEHTDLRKLRHPREQHELQEVVRTLEGGVESFQSIPIDVFQRSVEHVEYGLVIFVYQHYGTSAGLFESLLQ